MPPPTRRHTSNMDYQEWQDKVNAQLWGYKDELTRVKKEQKNQISLLTGKKELINNHIQLLQQQNVMGEMFYSSIRVFQ